MSCANASKRVKALLIEKERQQKWQPRMQRSAAKAFTRISHLTKLSDKSAPYPVRLTRLICDIVPGQVTDEMLDSMLDRGMNVVHIETEFDSMKAVSATVDMVRRATKRHPTQNNVGITFSLKGTGLRSGALQMGLDSVILEKGTRVRITNLEVMAEQCCRNIIFVNYEHTATDIRIHDSIVIDGLITLLVTDVGYNYAMTRVITPGVLGNYKDVYLIRTRYKKFVVSEKDRSILRLALKKRVHGVSIPFVQEAETVEMVRQVLGAEGKGIEVFANIGSVLPTETLEAIIKASDGIVVAFGMLHFSTPITKLFLLQKVICGMCLLANKPVAVPFSTTRCRLNASDATDITNAILDGATSIRLGFTTQMASLMAAVSDVCREAESLRWRRAVMLVLWDAWTPPTSPLQVIAMTVSELVRLVGAVAIVVLTTSGRMATLVSRTRPLCPVIAVTRDPHVASRLCIMYAVIPVVYKDPPVDDWLQDTDSRLQAGLSLLHKKRFVHRGYHLRSERKKFVPYSSEDRPSSAVTKNVQDNHENSRKLFTEFSRYNTPDLRMGALGWGKLKGSYWWPAIVIDSSSCGLKPPLFDNIWVYWIGHSSVSEIPNIMFVKFAENFSTLFNMLKKIKNGNLLSGIVSSIKYHAQHVGYNIQNLDDHTLLTWANNGFPVNENKTLPLLEGILPSEVQIELNDILGKIIPPNECSSDHILYFENLDTKLKLDEEQQTTLNKLKSSELTTWDICISCLSQNGNLSEHPIFEASICEMCIERVKKYLNFYVDGSKVACSICFNKGGNLNCKNSICNATFCEVCVLSFEIRSDFVCPLCCDLKIEENVILRTHGKIQQRILNLYGQTGDKFEKRKSIRVLSLFDGIGSGYFVLNKLGLSVNKYYASEIDGDAIEICKKHGGLNIVHLGDILKVSYAKLVEIVNEGPIDLVIGGSPCNDLSLANPDRKGPFDFSGTGPLFFEYYRILSAVKLLQRNYHFFWLFENVANMPNSYKEVISSYLGLEPVMIDAAFFSPQKRERYFWGNIPGLGITVLPSRNYVLGDYLLGDRKATVAKLRTVTTTSHSLRQGKDLLQPVLAEGSFTDLWPTELEVIFGFPPHYTDVGNITPAKRKKLLGKSWSAPVIEHILSSLKLFFNCNQTSYIENLTN